jgi:hypothetical protein
MTQQTISSPAVTPTYATPSASDTITPDSGQFLHIKNGGTVSTITVVIPGNQPLSGVATTDNILVLTSTERMVPLDPGYADPTTGLITVTYSSTATVTVGLFKR